MATFFGALIPEGQTEHEFRQILHAGRTVWLPLLERLGDESSGALAFTDEATPPGDGEAYEPVGCDFFERLARDSGPVTVDTLWRTRVSVTGAMR